MSAPRRPGKKGEAYAEVKWPDGRRVQVWVDADKVTPEVLDRLRGVNAAVLRLALGDTDGDA